MLKIRYCRRMLEKSRRMFEILNVNAENKGKMMECSREF
jgi:hypothetical protein